MRDMHFFKYEYHRNGNENPHERNKNTKINNIYISLKDNNSGLKWLYSNASYLTNGTCELRLSSDSKTDLDSDFIYPIGNSKTTGNNEVHNETLEHLFNPQISPPVQISGYKKINPTKHILNITNATRPYMVSFAESYDPLWRAYADTDDNNSYSNTHNDNTMIKSVPLYSVTNGFYINKTGDYNLIIEYQPQKWFLQGAAISILFLVAMFAGLLILRKRRDMRRLYLTYSKKLSKYWTDKKTN